MSFIFRCGFGGLRSVPERQRVGVGNSDEININQSGNRGLE